jgi:hypothetical protein
MESRKSKSRNVTGSADGTEELARDGQMEKKKKNAFPSYRALVKTWSNNHSTICCIYCPSTRKRNDRNVYRGEGAELVLKRDASTWTCQQHVKIHPLSFSTPKHACSYNRRRGEGKENIKLYIDGVTTPVTNSFIQCKSVHKASCIRAPGKKRRRRRGWNSVSLSARFHLPRFWKGCALVSLDLDVWRQRIERMHPQLGSIGVRMRIEE